MKSKLVAIITIIILATVSLFTMSCTSARISSQFTSGQVGCLPEKITITNETAGLNGMHNWIAECNGKKYVCVYHYGDGAKCSKIE